MKLKLGATQVWQANLHGGTSTHRHSGRYTGSYDLSLKIDDGIVDTARVTLAAGASEEVKFTVVKDTAGTYAVDINGEAGTFVTKKQSSWWNNLTGNIGNWWNNTVGSIGRWFGGIGDNIGGEFYLVGDFQIVDDGNCAEGSWDM